jgi:hypothetical protein
MNTREKGEYAKLKIMLRAAELGFAVNLPTTEMRYDMVLEKDGRFMRAQVKYADGVPGHASGSVPLALHRRGKLYMDGEIDVLLVYLPKLDQICWFGPEVFHEKEVLYIRYEATKSGQTKGCLMAQDYLW